MNSQNKEAISVFNFSAIGIILFLCLLVGCNFIYTVGAGERGVVLTFGKVKPYSMDEGIHFKIPLVQKAIKLNVRILKTETVCEAASKDMQETNSKIALNYHILPDKAHVIYQSIGKSYSDVIIAPAIQEVTKAVTAKYAAVELITQREIVRNEIKTSLRERMMNYNIIVDDFSIVNFGFSKQFTEAIEAKQTADQLAQKATRDLERIKIEAEQTVASAKADSISTVMQASADAKALSLKRQVLTPDLIKLNMIEKWNGELPSVSGGATPFISLDLK